MTFTDLCCYNLRTFNKIFVVTIVFLWIKYSFNGVTGFLGVFVTLDCLPSSGGASVPEAAGLVRNAGRSG